MLPIINKLKFLSYQRPTAHTGMAVHGPERSGGMLSSRPKKCWYAIPHLADRAKHFLNLVNPNLDL